MSDTDEVTVWRAPSNLRTVAIGGIVALLVLISWVAITFGYLAAIAILLGLAAVFQAWWLILRPRLVAGPDGVRVVWGRTPVTLAWKDIRRVEPTPAGLKIVTGDNREVISRFPAQTPPVKGEQSVADRAASYLIQRAAWERKPSGGPRPRYIAPES